jgi:hypothetical protein
MIETKTFSSDGKARQIPAAICYLWDRMTDLPVQDLDPLPKDAPMRTLSGGKGKRLVNRKSLRRGGSFFPHVSALLLAHSENSEGQVEEIREHRNEFLVI